MTPRRRSPSVDSSWMSLLASTALGVDGSTVRAHIRLDDPTALDASRRYRLVVQSYDGSMRRGARPVGSTQRVVTAAELSRGVDVSLVELRDVSAPDGGAKGLVVAWIEEGTRDLELDARAARPRSGQMVALARRAAGVRAVSLSLAMGRKTKLRQAA